MPNIFDNLHESTRIGDALRASLEDFDTLDVATGYLDLRGWATFADLIDNNSSNQEMALKSPQARVLVGMIAPSDSQELLNSLQDDIQPKPYGTDIHDMEKALVRREALVKHLRQQLMRGLASANGQKTLQTLKRQLETGAVEMRVFTERPLHGKTYIFHSPQKKHGARWAYVGSSNLTGAGLFSNLELNIDVQDSDASTKLARWFDDRWEDPFSLPITADIIEIIANSWASDDQPTPFELYLKVCHSLSQDARDGMGYVLPQSMQKLLLNYQSTAVKTLARRIVRRGGTMLGDVVGLGKTLTAIATALMLEAAEDYNTLVLCPKNLEQMWNTHLEKYEVDGRVVPYSMADRVLPDLKRYNLVICDESHNLRNSGTLTYDAIKRYVQKNTSKVLLLTATPYNLAFEDVANQIGLYIEDDEDLGITPAAAIAVDPNLINKVDGKINTLSAFRRSEEAEDWKRLMSDHLVRRTRSFVKRGAEKETVQFPDGTAGEREYLAFADGTRFFFPNRLPKPLSHAFAHDDPAQLMESDGTLDAIRSLSLPRYRLADYDNPKAHHTASDDKNLADIRSGRGNVSGFVRTGLFKRLSSSGHSFIVSLQRQRARNDLFIYAIEHELPVPLGSFSDRQINVSDDDPEDETALHGGVESRYEQLVEVLPGRTKWVNTTVFKTSLRRDLVRDNAVIDGLLKSFGSWDPSRDSKVNALVDLIRDEHPSEKILIFTEYKDTAEYIAGALTEAGIDQVGLATGETLDPSEIARRFSPESNRLPGDETEAEPNVDPLQVLVATDVLSEGQNLQDCHIVVNYDLPWAIVRIIQRAGRVDRVGQQADHVFIYLITHEKVEQQINLRQRIKDRLGASAEAFGSDEQFFGSETEVQILGDFYNGKLSDEADDGEADAVSEAWLSWSNAQRDYPEIAARVLRMQDMVHSTRASYVNERSTGVTCFVTTVSGADAFATSIDVSEGETEEHLLTPMEALRTFQAQVSTPTISMRPDHFERQRQLLHDHLATDTVRAGNLRGIRKWAWERLGGNTLFSNQASEPLNALHERPLTEYAAMRLGQARRNRYSLDDLVDLLNQLHSEDRLVVRSIDSDAVRIVCSLGVSSS